LPPANVNVIVDADIETVEVEEYNEAMDGEMRRTWRTESTELSTDEEDDDSTKVSHRASKQIV